MNIASKPRRRQLTKIQIQERANRRHRVMLARGLATPKGTKPRHYEPVAEPAFKPAPMPSLNMGFFDSIFERLGWKKKRPEVPDRIEPKGIYKQ